MKFIFCAFVFCAFLCMGFAGHHHDLPEPIKNASNKCKTDLNMDENALKEYFHSHNKDSADDNIKCYFKCLVEGLKWMNENGDIIPNNEVGLPDDFVKFGTECKDTTGANDCDKAFKFHHCVMEKAHPKH